MIAALLLVALAATSNAAEYDGRWVMTSLVSPQGEKTAAELQPEGCTSSEIWSFEAGNVSRIHERECATDTGVEKCSVMVSVMASDANTVLIPYTTEALSQVDAAQIEETTKKGATTTRKVDFSQMCAVRLDKATWDAKLDGDKLQLVLAGGAVTWNLEKAQ